MLLPGQRLAFPFLFKSPNCGVFSETWALHTGPVLGRGRPILLTLKGVTFQEDTNAQRRQEIEVFILSLVPCVDGVVMLGWAGTDRYSSSAEEVEKQLVVLGKQSFPVYRSCWAAAHPGPTPE